LRAETVTPVHNYFKGTGPEMSREGAGDETPLGQAWKGGDAGNLTLPAPTARLMNFTCDECGSARRL
jgi:hypothetical protein